MQVPAEGHDLGIFLQDIRQGPGRPGIISVPDTALRNAHRRPQQAAVAGILDHRVRIDEDIALRICLRQSLECPIQPINYRERIDDRIGPIGRNAEDMIAPDDTVAAFLGRNAVLRIEKEVICPQYTPHHPRLHIGL